MNKKQIRFIIIAVLLAAAVAAGAVGFYAFVPGNDAVYDAQNITASHTALTGKTIYWLGSSVTLGMESGEQAVADYIAARNGAVCVKEAVSGTTLIDKPYQSWFSSEDSYVTRLNNSENFAKQAKVDAFVCQISTNDAKSENLSRWGRITGADVTDKASFDVETTLGAMEYIIAYVWETWGCPVYFYSGAYFGDDGLTGNRDPSGTDYARLVQLTHELVEKWNAIEGYEVHIIDLYNDADFNDITDSQYKLYMRDPIHPLKAGYLEWWTPYFEEILSRTLPQV